MSRRPGHGAVVLTVGLLLADPLSPAVITVQGGCALAQAIRAANTDTPQGGMSGGIRS